MPFFIMNHQWQNNWGRYYTENFELNKNAPRISRGYFILQSIIPAHYIRSRAMASKVTLKGSIIEQ